MGKLWQDFMGRSSRAFSLTKDEKRKIRTAPNKIKNYTKTKGKQIDFGKLIGTPKKKITKQRKKMNKNIVIKLKL